MSHDKDITFTPKVYAEENILLLNEYRQAFEHGFLTIDSSFTEGYKNTSTLKTKGSRNHIFANLDFNFNQDNKIFNHASPTLDNYKDGNRRVGLYIWEYITFIRTCKFVGLGTKHFLVTRDPIERLASGLNTALHNTPDDEAQRVCGISFDNLNENFKGGMPDNINDGGCNTLCCNILKLLSSQYHAQGWLCHIDKHIDFEDYEIFSVDVNNLVPFAKEVLNLDIKETDKHLPDNQWHGAHTGTRPPNKRYFHNFLDIWLQENYNNNTLDKQLSNLIDAEYKVIDKLTQINYDINN